MQQPSGKPSGFGEQKDADLCDVRPGGDVQQVLFVVGVERISAGEGEELFVDLLEVPRVFEFNLVEVDFGFGRERADVFADELGEFCFAAAVEQFEAVNEQVGLAADGDGGAPVFPTAGSAAEVELGSEESDDDLFD